MSFFTHQNNGLLWLSSSLLDGQPVRHGFSTRLGGVSPAPWDSLNLGISRGDSDENVWENYRRFCAAVGVAPESTVFTQQTHSENIRQVTGQDAGKGLLHPRNYTDVDALITDCPGLSLVVFSADCGTILLFDPVHRAIGAVHAGWRGTAAGIAAKTALKMHDAFGTEPLPQESPLRKEPHAILTPHIAWTTKEALQNLMDITTRNLRTFLDGNGENIVNR